MKKVGKENQCSAFVLQQPCWRPHRAGAVTVEHHQAPSPGVPYTGCALIMSFLLLLYVSVISPQCYLVPSLEDQDSSLTPIMNGSVFSALRKVPWKHWNDGGEVTCTSSFIQCLYQPSSLPFQMRTLRAKEIVPSFQRQNRSNNSLCVYCRKAGRNYKLLQLSNLELNNYLVL